MHDKHVKHLERLEREQKLKDEEIRMKDELLRKTQNDLEELRNKQFFESPSKSIDQDDEIKINKHKEEYQLL